MFDGTTSDGGWRRFRNPSTFVVVSDHYAKVSAQINDMTDNVSIDGSSFTASYGVNVTEIVGYR